MKKISKILLENALRKDEIRSIKGGSGCGGFNGCRFDWDCLGVFEKCCFPLGGAGGCARGTCGRAC
jgi:hypothetical protein